MGSPAERTPNAKLKIKLLFAPAKKATLEFQKNFVKLRVQRVETILNVLQPKLAWTEPVRIHALTAHAEKTRNARSRTNQLFARAWKATLEFQKITAAWKVKDVEEMHNVLRLKSVLEDLVPIPVIVDVDQIPNAKL